MGINTFAEGSLMKEDIWLITAVFLVWMVFSVAYFTVPMIQMPTTGRVWGLGAALFLVLACVIAVAWHKGAGRRNRAAR